MKPLFTFLFTVITAAAIGQSYVVSESLEPDNIWSSFRDNFFTLNDDVDLSDWHDLPFDWNFYGTAVNQFRISENGYIIFNPSSETESNGANVSLSDAAAPDNAIFAFWDDFDYNYLISTWIHGTGNNRVYEIAWNWNEVDGVDGDCSFELRLYENCGDFDIVLGSYANTIAADLTGTVGCKKTDDNYTEVAGSPNHLGNIYKQVYSFHYEEAIERDLAIVNIDLNNHLNAGSHAIEFLLRNKANTPVNSFDLIYTVDDGPEQIHSVEDVDIEEDNGLYNLIHDVPLVIAAAGMQHTLDFWIENINGGDDQRTCNNELTRFVTGIEGNSAEKTVLLEKNTGTWCGYCIDGIVVLDELLETYEDRLIPVVVHDGDPMETESSLFYQISFSIGSFPSATIDRTRMVFTDFNEPVNTGRGRWGFDVEDQLEAFTPAELEIAIDYDTETRTVTATLMANYSDYSAGENYGLALMIIEDEMSDPGNSDWNQANNYNEYEGHPYYGAGSSIPDFVHKHVFREYIDSDCYGVQGVIPNFSEPGDSYSHTFTFVLDDVYDPENIELVGALFKRTASTDQGYSGMRGQRFALNAVSGKLMGYSNLTKFEAQSKMVVYPNPATAIINVQLSSSSEIKQVRFTDLAGKTVLKADDFTGNQIDISALSKGLYILELVDMEGNIFSTKLTKN
ncbi:MAG: thiol-disulfide isomerase/thioredoxin [Psychroserpens sp.]|jgi:thiol-disulfide isomerase/thioredoxin